MGTRIPLLVAAVLLGLWTQAPLCAADLGGPADRAAQNREQGHEPGAELCCNTCQHLPLALALTPPLPAAEPAPQDRVRWAKPVLHTPLKRLDRPPAA